MEEHFDIISKLKLYLGEDEIEKVFGLLQEYLVNINSSKLNDLIQYSGRYQKLKQDQNRGVIRLEDAYIEHNQIRYSLISLLDEIEIENSNNPKKRSETTTNISSKPQNLAVNNTSDDFRLLHSLDFDFDSFYYSMWSIFNGLIDHTSLSIKITFLFQEESADGFMVNTVSLPTKRRTQKFQKYLNF